MDEEGLTLWYLHAGGVQYRITQETAERIQDQMRDIVTPYIEIEFLDLYGTRCVTWSGQLQAIYETTTESRAAERRMAKELEAEVGFES